MTIQLTLPPALEKWLAEGAARREINIEAFTVELLNGMLPAIERAKSVEELFAQWDREGPADPDDCYDLYEALNANRAANGERLLFPPELKGVSW